MNIFLTNGFHYCFLKLRIVKSKVMGKSRKNQGGKRGNCGEK